MSETCLFYRAVQHGTVSVRHTEHFERFRTAYLAHERIDGKLHRDLLLARDDHARFYEKLLASMRKHDLAMLVGLTVDPDASGMHPGLVRERLDVLQRQFRDALDALEERLIVLPTPIVEMGLS